MCCAITRVRLLLLLGTGLLFLPVHAQFFTDVTPADPDHEVIENIAVNQLMEGYPDGSFRPDAPMCQLDGVMVMARLLNVAFKGFMVLPAPEAPASPINDIPPTHWAYRALAFLQKHGMLATGDTALKANAVLTRDETLQDLARLLHSGRPQPLDATVQEFSENCLLPAGWGSQLSAPVTRREIALLLEDFLFYLTQHAVTEGEITAFEVDRQGTRWVHLTTVLGEARLNLPTRGVMLQGGKDELAVGTRIRTLSDAVNSGKGMPFFRVREVTVLR